MPRAKHSINTTPHLDGKLAKSVWRDWQVIAKDQTGNVQKKHRPKEQRLSKQTLLFSYLQYTDTA